MGKKTTQDLSGVIVVVLTSFIACSCTGRKQQLIDKADAYYNKGIDLILSGTPDSIALFYFDSALMYHERPEYYAMRGAEAQSDCALKLGFKDQAITYLHVADSLGSTYARHILDSLKIVNQIK